MTATKWLAKHPRPGAHVRVRGRGGSAGGCTGAALYHINTAWHAHATHACIHVHAIILRVWAPRARVRARARAQPERARVRGERRLSGWAWRAAQGCESWWWVSKASPFGSLPRCVLFAAARGCSLLITSDRGGTRATDTNAVGPRAHAHTRTRTHARTRARMKRTRTRAKRLRRTDRHARRRTKAPVPTHSRTYALTRVCMTRGTPRTSLQRWPRMHSRPSAPT